MGQTAVTDRMRVGNAQPQPQRISERSTRRPCRERRAEGRSGDTSITRHGRNPRRFENGLKNAMPSPPLVIASIRPCDAVLSNSTPNAVNGSAPSAGAKSAPVHAMGRSFTRSSWMEENHRRDRKIWIVVPREMERLNEQDR